MERISKENFANLLNDLYEIFNPEHKSYVAGLVERNIDIPLDSVDMIMFKYNQEHLDFYDPEMNKQTYQMQLVSQYAKGQRPLKELDIVKRRAELDAKKTAQAIERHEAEVKAQAQLIDNKATEIEKKTKEEISAIKKEMEKALKELQTIRDEAKKNPADDGVDYKIRVNYTEAEIELPNAKKLAGLGIGARIIAKSTQGRPVGLVVKDITYDDFSHPEGRTVIDIILDKA